MSVVTRIAGAGALGAWLAGRSIGTPYPRVPPRDLAAEDRVVVVLTRIKIDTRHRAEFNRQTRLVIDSMPTHRGLVAYAARRELFGDRASTVTVWADDASRARFVNSEVHRNAVVRSRPAVISVETWRLLRRGDELPRNWAEAIALLDNEEERSTG